MSGQWQISNRSSSPGVAATATEAAPAGWKSGNAVVRLRSLQASLRGTSAGNDQIQVLNGATVIWQEDMTIAANGAVSINPAGLDLRADPGNALVVQFVGGVANANESVNAQGDIVTQGWPMGQN